MQSMKKHGRGAYQNDSPAGAAKVPFAHYLHAEKLLLEAFPDQEGLEPEAAGFKERSRKT